MLGVIAMSVIDDYKKRVFATGNTKRERMKHREIRHLRNTMPDSLSFHEVLVKSDDGEKKQFVSITDSDNLEQKTLLTMPEENIKTGSHVFWADTVWLVESKDANNELYTKVKLLQCNYLLKWVNSDGELNEEWVVIEDGTKYLTGEYEDRKFVMTRGDSRVAITLPRNKKTTKLNRQHRFIIDDYGTVDPLAYSLSKPLKAGLTYPLNGEKEGIYKFILQEVQITEFDNIEEQIADYYHYYNIDGSAKAIPDKPYQQAKVDGEKTVTETGKRKMWL